MSQYTEDQLRDMGYTDSEVDAYFGRGDDDAADTDADDSLNAEASAEDDEVDASDDDGGDLDEEAEGDEGAADGREPAGDGSDTGGDDVAPEPIKDSSRYRPTPEPYLVARDAAGNEVQADEAVVNARLDAINVERRAISARLATGEISDEEAEDQRLALERERDLIRDHLSDLRAVRRANAERWEAAQEAFFETGIGKQMRADVSRYRFAALREALAEVGGSDEARGKSYSWMLETAGARVAKDLGLTAAAAKSEAAKGKPALRAVGTNRVPTTLADMPAAAANGARKVDEHEAVDRLAGEDLTLKVAMMTDAERVRYLRRGRG